jgi:hypothetical protein
MNTPAQEIALSVNWIGDRLDNTAGMGVVAKENIPASARNKT